MMTTMIERVARAIKAKLDDEFAERGGLAADEMADMAARAAIEAMREPTSWMMENAVCVTVTDCVKTYDSCGPLVVAINNALIDTALSEESR